MFELNFLRRFRRHLLWYTSAIRYLGYKCDQQLVIVTGANHNHFQSLLQFTKSVLKHEPFSHLIIFDLGLTQIQLDELQELISTNERAEIRRFPFELHPPHMDIEVAAGEYAWKPVIVHQICEQSDGFVVWCDAGNIIDKPLTWIRRIVQKDGIYCPLSSGIVTDWTHPGMISELGLPEKYFEYRNLNTAVIGLNPRLPKIAYLLTEWRDCALKPECIAPAGSSRENHRQDQAAFTVIAYKNNIIQQKRGLNYFLNLIWEPKSQRHPVGIRIQQSRDMEQQKSK